MTLEQLTEQGSASSAELRNANGIKKKFDLGLNEWGFREFVIIDTNKRQWDYIPEDGIYELRMGEAQTKYLNQL